MDLKLAGKTALITGANSGIGRATAFALAAEGVRVAISGRAEGKLQALATDLQVAGYRGVVICAGDLASGDGAANVGDNALATLGHVDILVNNAGGSRPMQGLVGEEAERAWSESLMLNFNSARRLADFLIPSMIDRRWGRILNITGAIVNRNVNAASAAKAALTSWSKGLAAEIAPYGITANCVSPGRIRTVQIMEKLHATEEARQSFIKDNIPIGYFGEPEDVANTLTFLASPLAGYLTGIVVPVDGGMHRLSF